MYIQITTKCNMACDHCCFACNKTDGENMSIRTFLKAVAFSENYTGDITLGGGEPTIHPKFWEFFGIAMGSAIESLWLATNGKKKETTIRLANIASHNDFFSVTLSQDDWHDPINQQVINVFKHNNLEIRNVGAGNYGEGHISNVGSAYENNIGNNDDCTCQSMFVKPDGEIKFCGCADSISLGNVHDIDDATIERAYAVMVDFADSECSKDLEEEHIDYIIHNIQFDEEEAA